MNKIFNSFRGSISWLLIFLVALLGFALALISEGGNAANSGYLVLGAAISFLATICSDALRRPQQAEDLARVLYVELAQQVARCWFDYQNPWKDMRVKDLKELPSFSTFRLRKFTPFPPRIFESAGGQMALLEGMAPGAAQSLMHFYFAVAAWQRDIENIANNADSATGGQVESGRLFLLAYRLGQCLDPGLKALTKLSPMVPEFEQIEDQAIKAICVMTKTESIESLRLELAKQISKLI